MTFVEVVYLIERQCVPEVALRRWFSTVNQPRHVLRKAAVDRHVARAVARVSRQEAPDMPDRIIVATAIYLGVPVIRRDRHIRAAALETVW